MAAVMLEACGGEPFGSEHRAHRSALAGVARGRSGAAAGNVVDLRGFRAGLAQGAADRLRQRAALRIGREQVLDVGGRTKAGDLGVHARAPRARRVVLLEHEERSALAHHGAVPLAIVGPAGLVFQLVVRCGHAERIDLGHVPPAHRGVGAAGENDVGLAAADGTERPPDSRQARLRAAGEERVGATQRKRVGQVEQRGPLEALDVEQWVHLLECQLAELAQVDPPVVVADRHGDVLEVLGLGDLLAAGREQPVASLRVLPELQAAVAHRQHAGDRGQHVVARHVAQRAAVDEVARLERRHLRPELRAQRRGVVARNRRNAAVSRLQLAPVVLDADAERGDEADPRDGHPPAHRGTARSLRARVTTRPSTDASPVRVASASVRCLSVTVRTS